MTLRHRPGAVARGGGHGQLRRLAGRHRDRVRRQHGQDGHRPELRRLRGAAPRAAPPRNLTTENPASDTGPRYSPDGRYLAFGRQAVKGFYGDRVRLVVHDRKAGTNSAWWPTRSTARSRGVVWTPDAARVYAARGRRGPRAGLPDRRRDRPAHAADEDKSFSALDLSTDGKRAGRAAAELHRAADAGERRSARAARPPSSPPSTTSCSPRSPSARTKASPTRARAGRTSRCG